MDSWIGGKTGRVTGLHRYMSYVVTLAGVDWRRRLNGAEMVQFWCKSERRKSTKNARPENVKREACGDFTGSLPILPRKREQKYFLGVRMGADGRGPYRLRDEG